jgi:hypothetical protein
MAHIVAARDMVGLAIDAVVELAIGPVVAAEVLVGRRIVELAIGSAVVAEVLVGR